MQSLTFSRCVLPPQRSAAKAKAQPPPKPKPKPKPKKRAKEPEQPAKVKREPPEEFNETYPCRRFCPLAARWKSDGG